MSLLSCNPDCFEEKVPQRYDLAACGNKLRAFGYDSALFFHCSLLPEFLAAEGATFDITNVAHWEAAVALDLITRTPCGSFELGSATDEVAGEDGCGNQIIDYSQTPFTFETFQTADDKTDENYFFRLDKGWDQYTMGWISCDGCIYLNDETTASYLDSNVMAFATGHLGYRTTKTSRPQWVIGSGKGKAGKWTFQGFYRNACVSRGIEVIGLVEALAAA